MGDEARFNAAGAALRQASPAPAQHRLALGLRAATDGLAIVLQTASQWEIHTMIAKTGTFPLPRGEPDG
jgi:hypothetical protein